MADIIAWLQEYWLGLAFLGLLIFLVIRKKVLARKAKKKLDKIVKKPVEEIKPQPAKVEQQPAPKQEETFEDFFDVEEDEKKKKPVLDEIKTLNKDLDEDGYDLDEQTKDNFENLRKELNAVNKRKEEIKLYGLGLAKLYSKYRKRERHLTGILSGMEKMIKYSEQSRQMPLEEPKGHDRLYND